MKKYILCFLACIFGMGHALSDNRLTVSDVTLPLSGTATIDISCSFDTHFLGYQLEVKLNEGLELVEDDNGSVVCENGFTGTDHSVNCLKKANHTYRFMVVSMTGKQLPMSGSLLRMSVRVESGASSLQGLTVSAKVTTAKFTTTAFDEMPFDDVSFTINVVGDQTSQSLNLSALPTMTEGDDAYTLPQNTDQGLTLTWSVADATIASISDNKLTPLKAGTTTVTATQEGNDDFLPFTTTFTLTVKEKPTQPTIEVTDISQMDNVIYVEPMETKTGAQATISFKMKNTAEIRSFQFDLYLPEGVTAVKSSKGRIQGSLSADRLPEEDEHRLTFSEHEGGFIRFLCDSEYGDTFAGNDGEIATLLVNIAETMADGDYAIVMKEMKLSEVDIANYYQTVSISTKLTISSYMIGDINGDNMVDVSDYSGVASHIHGNTPDGFMIKAADVDESGNIDVSDYSGIANLIHYGSIHGNAGSRLVRAPRQANTDVSQMDNVIYIKPFTVTAGTQTNISICMKNTAEIRSFQFDLYLPEGVTAVKSSKGRIQGSLSEGRLPEEDTHRLTFSEHEGGIIRFLCDSEYGDTFTGNDGEIATLQVNIAETMADGDYAIVMKDMKLSEVDIANYYQADNIKTTLTIGNGNTHKNGEKWGDVNDDGEVDVADIATIISIMASQAREALDIEE